eukprot:scaffold51340_cov64-Phaeocystis_antarctica.AAC.4
MPHPHRSGCTPGPSETSRPLDRHPVLTSEHSQLSCGDGINGGGGCSGEGEGCSGQGFGEASGQGIGVASAWHAAQSAHSSLPASRTSSHIPTGQTAAQGLGEGLGSGCWPA